MSIVLIMIMSALSSLYSLQMVSPYGAKNISLAEGGRAFISGYDAIMVNPAGAYFVEDSETGFGVNFGYGSGSTSLGYAGSNGFQAIFAVSDIDKKFAVEAMKLYMGYSHELAKWWIVGINAGYNFNSKDNGFDMNFGISFGPGLRTATRSGFIGAVTIRNPFERAGTEGEVSGTIGYSYRSLFNISIDNIYVFRDFLYPILPGLYGDRYDIVFAVETFPLESDDFSMTFSGRINAVGDYNQLRIGMGMGYVSSETSRFNFGIYATEFNNAKIEKIIFGFSFVQGM